MEQSKKKHILYSICFVCLALVDWIRGSQKWVFWVPAIILTGVFVSIVMMSHFCWKKEPLKPYFLWLGTWLVGSVVGYGIWRVNPGDVFLSQYGVAAFSVFCVGIVAIRVWRERRQLAGRGLGNPFLLGCWIVMSILMCFSRMGEIWPIWYVVVFGLFYLIPFSEAERKELWNGLADGFIISFFILQIFAYGFRPYDALRYSGAYSNCNMNALFYMVTYIALLYRSHSLRWQEKFEDVCVTWKRKLVKLFLWILTAGIWGFIFLTMTRTALLAVVMITLIYGVIEFGIIFREKVWRIFLRGVALLLGIVLTFPAVYLTVRYLPTILHHPIWFEGEYSVSKVHSYDSADSEKYVTFEEVLEGLLGRLGVELAGASCEAKVLKADIPMLASSEVTVEKDSLLTGEDTLDSGKARLRIWELYLENMNFAGHELEEGYFQITPSYHAWHAQNVFLQVAFCYGIIPGVLFVLLIVGLGIQALRLAVSTRRCEDLLPLLVGLVFVGYGMLECVWYPGQTILLLIYLIPGILIGDKRKLQENKLKDA